MQESERLLKSCEELKQKIQNLKSQIVDSNYKTVYEIQLKSLQDLLTEVGRRLQHLNMYKDDKL